MNTPKPVRAVIFGKAGCDKCKVLRKRVESYIARDLADQVDCAYVDVETEDGLVAFCRTEGLNPQRIPALLLEAYDPASSRYQPIPRSADAALLPDPTRLPRLMGLQTDYSDEGKGVLSPRAIRDEIQQSLAAAVPTASA